MKVYCTKLSPPIGALFIAAHIKSSYSKEITYDYGAKEDCVIHPDGSTFVYRTGSDLARLLAKYGHEDDLLGRNALEKSHVDSWICFAAVQLAGEDDGFVKAVSLLNRNTTQGNFLVGGRVSVADYMVLGVLIANPRFKPCDNVLTWFNRVRNLPAVTKAIATSPNIFQGSILAINPATAVCTERKSCETTGKAQEGKFVELPGAEMGKVVVRFPPEASGYLHIGHAKAALLNQYYQQAFEGRLIMRFDDTNPAKEDVHFEQVILEDVAMLQIKPDLFTHTSQYFDEMLGFCEQLLKSGDAYVDDTELEQMRTEREGRIESANRSNEYEKNLKMWQEMKVGSDCGQKCCVRAKIDMQSANGCLRDPTIYRCKNERHPRTGTKYKVYPTYDFACPIVDAIENVTHTLRTTEYHDRDAQFYWFIEKLGLRRPYIWDYSRLSMTNTVLSKRKLTWFVQEGHVDGWDDARMPTVRGILRRGMTVDSLKQFIIAQGSSRSVVFMEWDKIWAFNKKVIDPIAPRYTAMDFNNTVQVNVNGVKIEKLSVAKHPKNPDIGIKDVWISDTILIDRTDALQLKPNENTTFINWGNLLIKNINMEDGVIKSIDAQPNLENKDYRKTLKLTWLAQVDEAKFTPTYCVYFDHLISKALLGKDEDFKQYIAKDTRKEVRMLGDSELKKLKRGDIIQLQRIGFFRVDIAYKEANPFTCREQPIVLFYIPDGHTKDSPNVNIGKIAGKVDEKNSSIRSATTINTELNKQADLVRDLKSKKASKVDIDVAVKSLLDLKAEFKTLTGADWQQGVVSAISAVVESRNESARSSSIINNELNSQADLVRDLKSKKASKVDIDVAVKSLLDLKGEFKTLTGADWQQGVVSAISTIVESRNESARSSSIINNELNSQADLVRDLKSKKASKVDIDVAVKSLLDLKAEFKTLTGADWQQGVVSATSTVVESRNESARSSSIINNELNSQADLVRDLKSKKASKVDIDVAVKSLLDLKAEFKTLTSADWKQGVVSAISTIVESRNVSARSSSIINNELNSQADLVRDLKSKKACKVDIDVAVKSLLDLKAEFKTLTGADWQQGVVSATSAIVESRNESARSSSIINNELNSQADLVRDLKSKKASKVDIDVAVKSLLDLKAEFKTLTGADWQQGVVSAISAVVESRNVSARSSSIINNELNSQADLVRDLKSKKASKVDIDVAVKSLLDLKAEFKTLTGADWQQGVVSAISAVVESRNESARSSSIINNELNSQADLVRDLKSKKASKVDIDIAVKSLLDLKAEFKTLTGADWKQGAVAVEQTNVLIAAVNTNTSINRSFSRLSSVVSAELNTQADLVRDLKSKKAPKVDIDVAVKQLLALKVEFKALAGTDWKQAVIPVTDAIMSAATPAAAPTPADGDRNAAEGLTATVDAQAEVVRTLKSKNAAKVAIDSAVKELLVLKGDYKKLTGNEFPSAGRANRSKEAKNKEKSPPVIKGTNDEDAAQKKQTRLCIEAKKEQSLSSWYSEVITKGEMIEYYDVSGCYILRPWSFSIWDVIREWFDGEIKKLGVQNCYFPIFVSKAVLEKEKTHIADFAPEVAWVTKSGNSDMAEPIAVRPTSETVMYPAYAKWIQSHRDLPIKLNQWNNVVRWEFSNPQPFLRTREFLWQEGHTAHATAAAAQAEVRTILELYARIYTDLLAVPVIRGRKTEKEKFAGADYTTTVEAFVSASGRAVQGATSHFLGQNFSRMFDITYEVPGKNEKKYVEQTSWGISTRSIGVMIMVHGDNTGLVLPPRVASVQCVIVPCGITAKSTESDRNDLQNNCTKLEVELRMAGVRVHGDYRDNQSPGWKYSHWELKGVPVRIEYGPKDIVKKQLVAVRRDTGAKIVIERANAVKDILDLLDNIQKSLYNNALNDMDAHKVITTSWDVFCSSLEAKNIILAPFCGEISCEERVKAESARTDSENVDPGAPSMGGKSLCIPFEQPAGIVAADVCIHPACKKKPQFYTLFGRSY